MTLSPEQLDTPPTKDAHDPFPPRRAFLYIAAVTLIALGLRIWVAGRSGLWRDEGLFLGVVQGFSLPDMFQFLRTDESHPPLFYLMMRLWLAVLGKSETAAMSLPLLIGAALVPAAYLAAAAPFGRRAGALAALLATVSPLVILEAASVRPYALLPLLALLSAHLLWRALVGGGGRRAWAAYAIVTVLMLYTHNWGWLIWAAEWVAFGAVLAMWGGGSDRRGTVLSWLVAQGIIGALYLPWLPTLLYQARHAGHSLADRPIGFAATGQFFHYLAQQLWGVPALALMPVVGALVALSVVVIRRRTPGIWSQPTERAAFTIHTLVGLVAAFLPLLFLSHANLLIMRCYCTVAPSLLVATAAVMVAATRGGVPGPVRSLRTLSGAVALLLTAGMAIGSLGNLYATRNVGRSNAREVAEALSRLAPPNDLVVVAPEWIASSFNYYFIGSNPQIDFPVMQREQTVRFGNIAARTSDPEALRRAADQLTAARKEGKRVWLVTTPRVAGYDLALDAPFPPEFDRDDYASLGGFRAAQLAAHLTRLYGVPQVLDLTPPGPGKKGYVERIVVFLFAPQAGGK